MFMRVNLCDEINSSSYKTLILRFPAGSSSVAALIYCYGIELFCLRRVVIFIKIIIQTCKISEIFLPLFVLTDGWKCMFS